MGTHHGVYVTREGNRLHAYLHKPSADRLLAWDAVSNGTVDIDTGLVWLDAETARRLVVLAQEPAVALLCGERPQDGPPEPGLNLYGDLLLPLARSTVLEDYILDTSDGPATSAVRAARHVIWQHLRGVPFAVERLEPAAFLHFGTSREYCELVAGSPVLARACGWTPHAASWIAEAAQAGSNRWAAISAVVAEPVTVSAGPVLIIDAHLRGPLVAHGAALIVGLSTAEPLVVEADTVVHQHPLPNGYITRVYGLGDDPKRAVGDPTATFMNRPWAEWLSAAHIDPELIWPNIPDGARTLWTARLYPIAVDRDQSLSLSLPLQAPGKAPAGWRERWARSPRLSLAESFAQADSEQILSDLTSVEDEVAAWRFCAAIEAETPATESGALLGAQATVVVRRATRIADRLQAQDTMLQLRGYKALSQVTGERHWEDRAFRTLATVIKESVSRQRTALQRHPPSGGGHVHSGPVRVEAAARIDFGGGWTDTPPYSIERGGTVLNAAVTLNGGYPIVVEAEWLPEAKLVLESKDIGAAIEPAHLGEMLAYANPADPFALLKAAMVLRGIVPAEGDPDEPVAAFLQGRGGVRLCTRADIPRGSGLGTSSILAGAVLACLARLLGVDLTQTQLFDEVLCLEQMMTTGGGWQDQVGGLTGGIKLITTGPGLPQQIRVSAVRLPEDTRAELADRLCLVYTGQQRLAKNLLRAVMGRWMGRDPEMVWIQSEIARLAVDMRTALEAGDVSGFGALLSEHWALNKRMDPGCTNPFIDDLFAAMAPFIDGGKLAGAGGGGFAIVVARDGAAAKRLDAALQTAYAGTTTAVWPCGVPDEGMACVQGPGPRAG